MRLAFMDAAGVITSLLLAVAGVGVVQDLPAGDGRTAVTARCLGCHEADLITQQRLSRAGWVREVDKMIRWGAVVEAPEREAMLDYLAAHFGRPAAASVASTSLADGTYKRACLTCHDEDLISGQRLARAGWTREVDKMIRWGAAVSDADKGALVDYLSTRFPVR
jgi:cytochrome c553